jgi:hypothetical protein
MGFPTAVIGSRPDHRAIQISWVVADKEILVRLEPSRWRERLSESQKYGWSSVQRRMVSIDPRGSVFQIAAEEAGCPREEVTLAASPEIEGLTLANQSSHPRSLRGLSAARRLSNFCCRWRRSEWMTMRFRRCHRRFGPDRYRNVTLDSLVSSSFGLHPMTVFASQIAAGVRSCD